MLSVWRDVSLPKILEIVIVGSSSAALNFCQDPPVLRKSEEEVGAGVGHEALLWGQDHFLDKAELTGEEESKVVLNGLALRSVDMEFFDPIRCCDHVVQQLRSEVVDSGQLIAFLRRRSRTNPSLVSHRGSFTEIDSKS